MKKFGLLVGSIILVNFSYSVDLTASYNEIPVNLFINMYNYAKDNVNNSYTQAYKEVANEFGLKSYVVKEILNGKYYYCLKNFNKLGIKPDKDGNYKVADFIACRDKLKEAVDNYVQSKLIKFSVDNALKGENVLADGDPDNGSYDLLVDFKVLTEILFKKEIKLNTKFNLLAGNGKSGGSGNNGQNNESAGNGTNNPSEGNNNPQNTNPANNLPGNTNNSGTEFENNSSNQSTNSSNSYLPNNLPIGNSCATKLAGNSQDNNGGTGNAYGHYIAAAGNNGGNGNGNGNGNQNTYEDTGFNVFGEKDSAIWPIDSGDVVVSPKDVGVNVPGGGGGSKSCPGNGLLSICVKLVPSGPRGPVGGTVKKRSIEEVIDKISDVLKHMRYSWIVLAGHGDEALDIDFKHVSLPDIFAFNIILTPKPVFNFKRNKKVIKQENLPDTYLKDVPRKLAKVYADLDIVDGFNPQADFKKYLITDLDKIQPYKRVKLNYPENVNTNSSKGIFAEEENYKELTTSILNMLDAMEEMTKAWIGSSIALYEKSTF